MYRAQLKAVLLYHVVTGKVTAAKVVKLTSAKSLEGASLARPCHRRQGLRRWRPGDQARRHRSERRHPGHQQGLDPAGELAEHLAQPSQLPVAARLRLSCRKLRGLRPPPDGCHKFFRDRFPGTGPAPTSCSSRPRSAGLAELLARHAGKVTAPTRCRRRRSLRPKSRPTRWTRGCSPSLGCGLPAGGVGA